MLLFRRAVRCAAVRRAYSTVASPVAQSPAADPDLLATSVRNPFTDAGVPLRMGIAPRAVTRLNAIARDANDPDTALRVTVESGGCHGFQYQLALTSLALATPEDSVMLRDGAHVIADESLLHILRDTKVDYTNELIGSQFKVLGGYLTSSCGCGSLFDFDMDAKP